MNNIKGNESELNNINNILTEKASINKGKLSEFNKAFKYIEDIDLNIPLDLRIEEYSYYFKYYKKINKEIIYRCKYANSCKVYISINLDNIKKIISKEYDDQTSIFYKYNNSNNHTCEGIKDITLKKIHIK